MDVLMDDDTERMLPLLQIAIADLASDYLLSESEIEQLSTIIKETVNPDWLCSMYQAGASTGSDAARQIFAYNAFDQVCFAIICKRPKVELPAPEQVYTGISSLVDATTTIDTANLTILES